jgi:hypothetical protein
MYTKPSDGCFSAAATATVDEAIPPGWSSDAVVLTVAGADWGERQVLEAWYDVPQLDPDRDCDLVNNRVPVEVAPCDEWTP